MKKCIKNFDFLSHKIHFTFDDEGKIRNKTFIGGGLSCCYFLLSISVIIYFIFKLLNREEFSVLYSNERKTDLNITYSHNLPFMLRLSDYDKKPINQENLFKITLKFWFNYYNEEYGDYLLDKYDEILLEKCDINKHFGEFKNYFESILNIDTFMCPLKRLTNQTLYGVYGDNHEYSFYHFYFSKCNISENEHCVSEEKSKRLLENAYLDLIYIDYSINHFNQTDMKTLLIKRDRFGISSSVYKRIWLYFNNIRYYSDDGLIFSSNKLNNFHQFDSIRIDTDLKDITNSDEPETFLTISIGNSGIVGVYNRKYLKFQDYLGIMSGMIKFLSFLIDFLNFNISNNSYYRKLIKDFILENKIKKTISRVNLLNSNLSKINLLNKSTKEKLNNQNKIVEQKLKEKALFQFNIKYFCFPLKYNGNNKNETMIIKWYIKTINSKLNIIKILNKLEKMDTNIQESIFCQEDSIIDKGIPQLNNYFTISERKKTKFTINLNENN